MLRHDPWLCAVSGKRQAERELLAGKSTLNRLELSPEQPSRYKKIHYRAEAVDELLVRLFVAAYGEPPERIVLDLDGTDLPLHGHQEGRFFHGYYDEYVYLPLYIFAGQRGNDAGQSTAVVLCGAGLRAGGRVAAAGATGNGVGAGASGDDPAAAVEDWGADPDHGAPGRGVAGVEFSAAGAVRASLGATALLSRSSRREGAKHKSAISAITGRSWSKNVSPQRFCAEDGHSAPGNGHPRGDPPQGRFKTPPENRSWAIQHQFPRSRERRRLAAAVSEPQP